jgi:hypothetical protein
LKTAGREYYAGGDSNCINTPINNQYAFGLHVIAISTYNIAQICFDYSSINIYYRICIENTQWREWTKIIG